MSKKVIQLFVVGALIVAGAKLFRFQEGVGEVAISKFKTRDPEQVLTAAAMFVALGALAVIASAAFGTVAKKAG